MLRSYKRLLNKSRPRGVTDLAQGKWLQPLCTAKVPTGILTPTGTAWFLHPRYLLPENENADHYRATLHTCGCTEPCVPSSSVITSHPFPVTTALPESQLMSDCPNGPHTWPLTCPPTPLLVCGSHAQCHVPPSFCQSAPLALHLSYY